MTNTDKYTDFGNLTNKYNHKKRQESVKEKKKINKKLKRQYFREKYFCVLWITPSTNHTLDCTVTQQGNYLQFYDVFVLAFYNRLFKCLDKSDVGATRSVQGCLPHTHTL